MARKISRIDVNWYLLKPTSHEYYRKGKTNERKRAYCPCTLDNTDLILGNCIGFINSLKEQNGCEQLQKEGKNSKKQCCIARGSGNFVWIRKVHKDARRQLVSPFIINPKFTNMN